MLAAMGIQFRIPGRFHHMLFLNKMLATILRKVAKDLSSNPVTLSGLDRTLQSLDQRGEMTMLLVEQRASLADRGPGRAV